MGIPLAAFANEGEYTKYFIVIAKESNFYKLLFMADSEGYLNIQYKGYYYMSDELEKYGNTKITLKYERG